MIATKLALYCLLLTICVSSAPVDEEEEEDDIDLSDEQTNDFKYEENVAGVALSSVPVKEEEDVEITDEQIKDLKSQDNLASKAGSSAFYPDYKWPTKKIPYSINETHYTEDDLAVFHEAIADIENKTCIRFVRRVRQVDYIRVRDGRKGKCNSKVGRFGGRQYLNLTPGCMRIRKKCVHELIHALGFRHMHQRFDRDTAVTIHWENVKEDQKRWFNKFDNKWEAYNTRYDLLSCMHYSKNGFSANGENTMVPNNEAYLDLMGKQLTLSNGDATRINRMYKCPAPYK